MERLARQKLSRPKKGSLTNPKNYRHHEPPYGYKVRDGQLVLNSTEIRICRLIVNLRGRRGKTLAQVAAELSKRGHKNRRGKTDWHHQTVGNIFKRWNGKL